MDVYIAAGAVVIMNSYLAGGDDTIVYFNFDIFAPKQSNLDVTGSKIKQAKILEGEFGFIVANSRYRR